MRLLSHVTFRWTVCDWSSLRHGSRRSRSRTIEYYQYIWPREGGSLWEKVQYKHIKTEIEKVKIVFCEKELWYLQPSFSKIILLLSVVQFICSSMQNSAQGHPPTCGCFRISISSKRYVTKQFAPRFTPQSLKNYKILPLRLTPRRRFALRGGSVERYKNASWKRLKLYFAKKRYVCAHIIFKK